MVLEAKVYESNSTTYTRSLYQHDKNVTLTFNGIDLPQKYEVSFSNDQDRGISLSREGNESGVLIPDALLSTGEYVYAWVCDTGELTGTGTVFQVVIPVIPRPIPIPPEGSSEGGGGGEGHIQYEIDPDEENLIIEGIANQIFTPNTGND